MLGTHGSALLPFEIRGAELAEVAPGLGENALQRVDDVPEGGCGLDHLWIYVDESD